MLAGGDPSVALVAVMHPTVLAWWFYTEADGQPAWEEQRAAVLAERDARPAVGHDHLRARQRRRHAPDPDDGRARRR